MGGKAPPNRGPGVWVAKGPSYTPNQGGSRGTLGKMVAKVTWNKNGSRGKMVAENSFTGVVEIGSSYIHPQKVAKAKRTQKWYQRFDRNDMVSEVNLTKW
jgi:hypothetical protein